MLFKKENWEKNKESGYPRTYIDNFIDDETCLKLYNECLNSPKGGWTVFTRSGSRMEEFNDLISCPTAHKLTYDLMYSGEFLYELEQLTGIQGLLPDPHLVGAGFSILRNGSELAPHYDFNWNDRIRLHRKLTSLLYITPNWTEECGGHNIIWDKNPEIHQDAKMIESVAPLFNRFILFENIHEGPVHSVSKIHCPEDIGRCAIRFFYYISSSEYNHNDPPHKSIYANNEYEHHKLTEEQWNGRLVGEISKENK